MNEKDPNEMTNVSNFNEAVWEDLGPINPNRPDGAHSFVWRPPNYPGPIAIDCTIRKDKIPK